MKKLIALLSILSLALLASCGTEVSEEEMTEENTVVETNSGSTEEEMTEEEVSEEEMTEENTVVETNSGSTEEEMTEEEVSEEEMTEE
ncbi:MAG: hypothetical protein P1U46_04100, partial [Patescibacteria group bacterium]|nr:hypothetical protein [Patescibacteria group bacterium]